MISEEQSEKGSNKEPSKKHILEHKHRKTIIDSNFHLEESQQTTTLDRNIKRKTIIGTLVHDKSQHMAKKNRNEEDINELHDIKLNSNFEKAINFNTDDKHPFIHSDNESAESKISYEFSSKLHQINELTTKSSEQNIHKGKKSTESCATNGFTISPISHRQACHPGIRDRQKNNDDQISDLLRKDFIQKVSKEECINTQSSNVTFSSTPPQSHVHDEVVNAPILSSMEGIHNFFSPLSLLSMQTVLQFMHPLAYSLHPFPALPHQFHHDLPLNFLPTAGPRPNEQSDDYVSALSIQIAQWICHLITSNPLLGQSLLLQMMNAISRNSSSIPMPFGFANGPSGMPTSSFQWTTNLNFNHHPYDIRDTIQASQSTQDQETENSVLSQRLTSNIHDFPNVSFANSQRNGGRDIESKIQHLYPSAFHSCYTLESIGPEVPESLPVALALPEDETNLTPFQYLLRQQIEVYKATENDITSHARGRNKPIMLDQVGIRCRHCATYSLRQRKKGAVYFPFTLLGIYQAAQNMASSHFIQGNCDAIPSETRSKLIKSISSKLIVGSGKEFWASSGRNLGLVDTEQGIRFIRDLVTDVKDSE
jgi:hypothetical protein